MAGDGSIDEIHVEIGRDMKQTAAERKKAHDRNLQNEAINLRIKALLTEFMNPEMEIKDVRPYSPRQQTLLHIYEEGAFEKARHDNDAELEEMNNIIDKFRQTDSQKRPTRAEIHRYRLWLDQKYVSPYTKRPIPLAELFTTAYEVEHIIPRARYFDDSYNNKVICEAEINKLKDKMLGFEFIKKHGGGTVNCQGREVRILTPDEYTCLVEEHFCRNPAKEEPVVRRNSGTVHGASTQRQPLHCPLRSGHTLQHCAGERRQGPSGTRKHIEERHRMHR